MDQDQVLVPEKNEVMHVRPWSTHEASGTHVRAIRSIRYQTEDLLAGRPHELARQFAETVIGSITDGSRN